jgi:hypothetical protein
VRAEKKLDLWAAPQLLVVHLKRFSYSRHARDKLDAPVDFPVAGLDLAPHMLRAQVTLKDPSHLPLVRTWTFKCSDAIPAMQELLGSVVKGHASAGAGLSTFFTPPAALCVIATDPACAEACY